MAGLNGSVPTETLDLGGGATWELRTIVTRGMRKRFQRASLLMVQGAMTPDVDPSDPDALRRAAMARPGLLDLAAVDDSYLREGTVRVMVPDGTCPVDDFAGDFDSLPEAWTSLALARMRVLYAEPSEGKGES